VKPHLLDLYCGAGGATRGYQEAGFHVTGIDLHPQPRYCGDEFVQMDALDALTEMLDASGSFDAIHASPPCQAHVKGLRGVNRALGRTDIHVDLIAATRALLDRSDTPYVIENVVGSPLLNPVRLCGSSFGLPLRRHRLFETTFPILVPPCDHSWQTTPRYWTSWRPGGEKRLATVVQVYGNAGDSSQWPEAMGIDWMTRDELREAIPPAYTRHIGEFLMQVVKAAA
jgi:DNA (cytosine-5)-methyltransferase 1